jgi:hypothetical protein
MTNWYQGAPLAPRALLVVGQCYPDAKSHNHNLTGVMYRSAGHNLWQLLAMADKTPGAFRMSRTDYAWSTELLGLAGETWEDDADVARMAAIVAKQERTTLLLGIRVFKACFPDMLPLQAPFRHRNFYVIAHPAPNNRAYENREAWNDNSAFAGEALRAALIERLPSNIIIKRESDNGF